MEVGGRYAPEAYVLSLLVEGRHEAAFGLIPEFGPAEGYAPHFANLGQRLWRAGDACQAQEVLRKALKLDPDRAPTWLALACVLLSQDETAEGERCLEEALRCDSHSASAHHLRGAVALASGRTAEAVEHFIRCLRTAPSHSGAAAELRRLMASVPSGDGTRARVAEALSLAAERAEAAPPATLSACLITRDKADSLARCLQSLRPVADQIVVVDTGSRDATVEIARTFGAEIHHFEWGDDFAAARNAAIAHATGGWILIVDADEELPPESAAQLKELLAHPIPARVCQLITHAPTRQSNPDAADRVGHLRLFRNGEGIRFEGSIHEQLVDRDGRLIDSAAATDIVVLHHGYLEPSESVAERGERNMRLMAARGKAEPDNPYILFHLGHAQLGCGRVEDAVGALKRAAGLVRPSHAFGAKVAVLLAEALDLLGRPGEAEPFVRQALVGQPEHPELLCALGCLLERQGRTDEAMDALRQATRGRFGPGLDYHDFTCRDVVPRSRLAAIHLARGEGEAALREVADGLLVRPEANDLRRLLGAVLVSLDRSEEACAELERILEATPDDALAHNTLGVALAVREDHEAASRQFGLALTLRPDDVDILCNLATAREALGDFERARDVFEAALERDPGYVPGWLGLAKTYLDIGAYDASARCYLIAAETSGYAPHVMAEVSSARTRLSELAERPAPERSG